jgi:hypothetical protein
VETFENLIAAVCVMHFVWSYYTTCYRKGYRMDIWHWALLWNVFSIHVMLPFDRSDLNIFALGTGLLRRTQAQVTLAYAISALGYFALLAGGKLWQLQSGLGLRRTMASMLKVPAKGSLSLLNARGLLRLHGLGSALAMMGIILLYFHMMGFGFDAGSILVANPSIRPFGQFSLFYGTLISSYTLVRALRYREPDMIVITILLFAELSFFGSRSSLLGVALVAMIVGMIRMGRRLRLLWLVGGAGFGLFLAIFLDAARRPNFSLQRVLASLTLGIFYGNSFSDVRDFAIILSFWDGHLFWGKTYLAGLFAFVPQVLSTFRTQWSLGVVTATMAGFSPTAHPGFRIGLSGEAYLNFGLVGVIMVGLFSGAVIRWVDAETKRAIRFLPASDLHAYSFWVSLTIVSVAQNSSGASTFYTTMLLLWISWLFVQVFREGRPGSLEPSTQAG